MVSVLFQTSNPGGVQQKDQLGARCPVSGEETCPERRPEPEAAEGMEHASSTASEKMTDLSDARI